MKSAFCLLLSVYVLLLSVLPCADESPLVRATDTPTQVAADHHTHQCASGHGDHCSPLCSCACCGTVLSQPPVFGFAFTPPAPVRSMRPVAKVLPLPSVSLSTWQPPQWS